MPPETLPTPTTGLTTHARPAAPWLPFGLLCAVLLALMACGHEGRRVLQMAALAAPLLAWQLWPLRRRWAHRLRSAAVWCWAMAFAFDGVVRAYLVDAYQAAPDSAMVLGAAANTTPRESAEYLLMYWRPVLLWAAVLTLAACLLAACIRHGRRRGLPASSATSSATSRLWRPAAALGCAALVLFSATAYASKPWRRLHPVAYWAGWSGKVDTLRAGMADQQSTRARLLQQGRDAAPTITRAGPSTVVLVITDSVNRDNMSLYGYGRPTTPRLQAQQAQLGDRLTVFRNAWSRDASTLPALQNLFRFGRPEADHSPHLIALARAAGYKVWWMSNHDDVAIEQTHALLADEAEFNNRMPGRSSLSLDQEVLDCVREALDDPAPRKLLIVHLMGAHPHYSHRFPEGDNPFDDAPDAVEAGLAAAGRPAWLRHMRHEYDAAVLYQDGIVSDILQMARGDGGNTTTPGYRAFMYLSDHGQEVGHGADRAGHSQTTAAGYRIPALVWQNRHGGAPRPGLAQQPLRTDWASWTLGSLLAMQWAGYRPERDVLHPAYRWEAPDVPAVAGAWIR